MAKPKKKKSRGCPKGWAKMDIRLNGKTHHACVRFRPKKGKLKMTTEHKAYLTSEVLAALFGAL